MSLSFGETPPDNKKFLREFLSHLYLECMVRYKNDTFIGNAVNETEENTIDILTEVPIYLEEAVLNQGSIDWANLNEETSKLQELYATISSMTVAPDISDITNNSFGEISSTSFYEESDDDKVHCPVRFDGYLCWPRTPGGRILSQYCPDFVEGFNSKFLAHKICLENGSWYRHPESGLEWSNYTNCIDYDDLAFRRLVNELYVKGYSVSCVALCLSLIIFLGFKSLRCTRIRIHVHLFASLALTCIVWILWYKCIIEQPEMIYRYPVFVKDAIVMRWFKIYSWLVPWIFITVYAVARYFHPTDNAHCWMDESLLLWIFSVPITLSLIASLFFLINVLRVIVRKLHPQSSQPAPLAIRKALRATIILVPLFGLQHFLIPYRPDAGTPLERFYQLLSVALISSQGFVVSFLFCFANHDVTFAVRTLLNRIVPGLVSPPPPSSNTGQLATTTPSRELGV
ncbi:calcitonin gene-related peptide type 1 receptor isoform X2 [Glossina fuscipes]|uniref:Calcitonin gene-related peptide type 1 receptor isoform X2 n=1 Tax=Glossina fuscipes TaxID=7396 RepID=A0A9C5Z5M6_9MUSC|nr:calcitonin gene-related peptide type 1 receptor isoform X2 [Glossina fuscipes]